MIDYTTFNRRVDDKYFRLGADKLRIERLIEKEELPVIKNDITYRLAKNKALFISINEFNGFVLENLAFHVFKNINGNNSVMDIINRYNNKKKILQILKEFEDNKIIYFK